MSDPPDLRTRFITGMSRAASTVNVVTTDGPAGRAGVTVSAMSSVSADGPRPTLLVCVHHASPAAAAILANGVFCVNVLRDDQSWISDAFAGRFRDELADKFDCTDWRAMPTGAPRVVDPLVAFDCRVLSSDRVGTHHVIFGEVEDLFVAHRGSPLLYAHRAYGSPSRIAGVAGLAAGREAAGPRAAGLTLGCFHTFGPFLLPAIIRGLAPLPVRLIEGDQRRIQEALLSGEAEAALVYDLDLAEGIETVPLFDLQPYVLLPEGHPLAGRPQIAPADLAGEPMVLLDAPPSGDYFTGLLRAAGVEPQVAFRSASFEMVRGLVGHGLGYALLATRPAAPMTYDGRALVSRALVGAVPPSRVVLARKAGLPPTPAAERLAWFCRDYFGADD